MSSTILETQLYPVHCTECGEKIDNRFFPLNRFLKQYFLGVAYSKKISNLVDFLGIGAMYGETVLPDVPDFYKDGKWLLDKPEISADKRPPEFSCGDNEVTADRLVQAQLNIAAMVAQFGLTTGFWEIYPMLKLRKELDDLAVAFGEPSSEQTAQWKTFCDKLARIPGVKADTLLTQDKRNAMIAGYLSDILTLAREEAKMAGKSHFASQEILIGWRYKVENNRKLPYAFVARGELTGSFDTRECCCDKCRRPIPWDLGAYRQKGFYGHPNIGAPVFDYVTFVGMFRSDLYEGLCVGHAPKKCPVCGRWFLTTNAKRTKYCGSYTPEDRLHRTCRQIGNLKGREQRELAEDHPLKQIYTRRLDSINHRLQRRSMEPALAKVMKKLAKDKLYQAISNVGYAQGEYENEMELSALEAEALALL